MIKTNPFVTIVIPIIGYKDIPSYLRDSLQLLEYPKDRLEIVFVKLISQRFHLPALKIKEKFVNSQNIIGYSQAANLGIKKGKGEFVFLINPDVSLDKYVLQNILKYYVRNYNSGVLGPVVFQLANPKKISPYDLPGINFHKQSGKMTPMTEENIMRLKKPFEVDWLSGCALFFPRKVWVDLNGFDEKLFIYWEDADFCMRAKKRGLKVVLVPGAHIWHEGSVYMTSQKLNKLYYMVRNGNYFIHKNSGFLGRVVLHSNNLLLFGVKIVRCVFDPKRREESYIYLIGMADFYRGKWGKRV